MSWFEWRQARRSMSSSDGRFRTPGAHPAAGALVDGKKYIMPGHIASRLRR